MKMTAAELNETRFQIWKFAIEDFGVLPQVFFDNLSTLLGAILAIQDMVGFGVNVTEMNDVVWSKIVPGEYNWNIASDECACPLHIIYACLELLRSHIPILPTREVIQ